MTFGLFLVAKLVKFLPWSNTWFVATLVWCGIYALIQILHLRREEKQRGRKMSQMSCIMAHGAYPDKAGPAHYGISCCTFTKALPTEEVIRSSVGSHFLKYKRLRSVPVDEFWKEVPVDLDDHIRTVEVENQGALDELIEALANEPINTTRPRWEVVAVRNNEVPSSASYNESPTAKATPPYHCLIMRFDHCIGDGVSFVEVLSSLMTDFDGNEINGGDKVVGLKRARTGLKARAAHAFSWRYRKSFLGKVIRIFRVIRFCLKVLRGIPNTLQMGMGPFDAASPFTISMEQKKTGVRFSTRQKIVRAGPWSLAYIKRIKSKLGVTVNDVFLGAFAGAIRRYCEIMGDTPGVMTAHSKDAKGSSEAELFSKMRCRALLPFAFLRSAKTFADPDTALSNKWTLLSVPFVVGPESRVERVLQTSAAMGKLKRNMQATCTLIFNSLMGALTPSWFGRQRLWDTFSRHSCVFANVPGPPMKVRLCGVLVEEIQVFYCNLLPQVEIFSYAGRVFFNLAGDSNIIKDMNKLLALYEEELRGLGQDLDLETRHLDFSENEDHSDLPSSDLSPSSSASNDKQSRVSSASPAANLLSPAR